MQGLRNQLLVAVIALGVSTPALASAQGQIKVVKDHAGHADTSKVTDLGAAVIDSFVAIYRGEARSVKIEQTRKFLKVFPGRPKPIAKFDTKDCPVPAPSASIPSPPS